MTVFSCLRGGFQSGRSRLLQSHASWRIKDVRSIRSKRNFDNGMNVGSVPLQNTQRVGGRIGLGLLKSFCFATGFTAVAFSTAAICRYEDIKQKRKRVKTWMQDRLENFGGYRYKEGHIRSEFNKLWNIMTPGEKVFWIVFGINFFVFVGWKIPALKKYMVQYFVASPALKAVCLPLLFSSFSHCHLIHFALNMFVMQSFSHQIGSQMGVEQYMAFYMSGGVFSYAFSNFYKASRSLIGPSIGASGAIMAILAFFCATHPDARLSIIFLPGFDFSAENALKCVVAFDCLGMIFGWKFFDHACHVGGAMFGVFYAKYGHEFIWTKQRKVIQKWRELTEK